MASGEVMCRLTAACRREGQVRRDDTARNRSRNAAFRRSRRHSNTFQGRGHGRKETDGEVTSGLRLALWSGRGHDRISLLFRVGSHGPR